jgi:hypothetical protein
LACGLPIGSEQDRIIYLQCRLGLRPFLGKKRKKEESAENKTTVVRMSLNKENVLIKSDLDTRAFEAMLKSYVTDCITPICKMSLILLP